MTEQDNRKIKEAIASCLSGVEALPSQRAEILRAAKGEMKVKRKMNMGLVLALILVLLTTSVAVAAELGLFGQIGQREHSDARLPGLENVSTVMDKTFDVGGGVTVTVHQAYYDGSRVFISYSVTGPYDVLELGTGEPGIVNYDREEQGVIFREQHFVDGPNGKPLMDWLNGSEPRWATHTVVNVHDGLQIGEEYLDIIGGEFYWLEDGTLMSWKECEIPAELAADEVTFSIGVFGGRTTYYQTADALYTSHESLRKTTWYDFTVKKNETSTKLTGFSSGEGWQAEAELTASAIDVKGDIAVKCPESWVEYWRAWDAPETVDCLTGWLLYVDGQKAADWIVEGVAPEGDTQLSFSICCKLDAVTADMKLVPVYRNTGEKPDEAILLTVAK